MTAPSQPPTQTPPRRELRPWTDFDQLTKPRPAERVATGSAVLLALLFHGMMFAWILPWLGHVMEESRQLAYTPTRTAPPPPPVEYSLTPMTPEDLQSMRYVEANPDAPVAKPDNTNNISNRDQRVAQPVPNPDGHSDMPATDGTKEGAAKIVPGDVHFSPQPAAPTPPTAAPSPAPAPATAPPVVIASSTPALPDKVASNFGEGIHLSENPGAATTENNPNNTPTTETRQNQQPLPPGPLTPEVVANRAAAATPQTRPNALAKTHAGPLLKNIQGTHVGGLAPALDSRLTPFGEYLSLMYEAIASAWYAKCEQFSFSPRDWGTQVEMTFVLNAEGEIVKATVENSTSSRGATVLCVDAVKTPAPYAKWTPEMRALLGDSYTMRVTFYYE